MTPEELKQHIDTVVVVMMENRSFDHVLGYLASPEFGNRNDVEGIKDPTDIRYINTNADGEGLSLFWTDDGPLTSDLPHDPEAVQTQLALSETTKTYSMNGFVRAFEEEFHTSISKPPVMGLLRPTSLPTTAAFAAKYTVCDHWFACIPTSTAPNRLMSMCGYTDIRDTGTMLPDQTTVYEWLLDHGVSWRVYYAGVPFFLLMPKMVPYVLTSHFRPFTDLAKDLANGDPQDWPQVIFIEPDYYDSPIHMRGACDNHAPLAMAPGERFLAEIYQALSGDQQRWARTVLIITYDEHGGCFDHVPPLAVKYRNPNGVAFDTTGPRVPAIVAGPFAPRGVSHAKLDNTSILQLLAERFGKPGEVYSSEVSGRKTQNIESVSAVLSVAANNGVPRDLPAAAGSVVEAAGPAPVATNKLHQAFEQAANDLATRHKVEAFAKFPQLRGFVTGQAPAAAQAAAVPVLPPQAPKPTSVNKLAAKRTKTSSRKPNRRS